MDSGFTWQSNPPEKLLAERFHITTGFHPGQREIIAQLAEGKRVLAIQRTGWGKSLCYQMASLYYPYLTIVFSPLKALMRDQCQRCNDAYAIPSAIISSDFSEEENRATLEHAVAGNFKILFIAPERLDNADWQTYVIQMRISLIVIDEAHCISTWGHDFRPHYRRIVRLLSALPKNVPILALTATANKRVEQDVLQQRGAGAQVIRGSMQRPNLHLHVETLKGDQEKLSYLGEMLRYYPGTGIIYTATKNSAEMVALFLMRLGINADYYHAGREDSVRQDIEQKLMSKGSSQYKVVCSTNALGMGIDKSDVRFVIHYHIPASPIHYYQEMGRAGRDSKVAWCILLYDPADITIQEHFIRNARPEGKHYDMLLALLQKNPQGLRESSIMLTTGFSQKAIRTILADLAEQRFIEHNLKSRIYTAVSRLGQMDFSAYDEVHQQKLQELSNIQNYVKCSTCYMEYLTTYLGDKPGSYCKQCGRCRTTNFPSVRPARRIQGAAALFLEEGFLPHIEKRPEHEAGWSLSYHGNSSTGRLVRASKYEEAGPFALSLVNRTVQLIRTRYPLATIDGIVSVPPTKSGLLVESFARQIAALLDVEYLTVLEKVRITQEQKYLTNWRQKVDNVKEAFCISSPEIVAGRTLLLIDDIYDSGYMLREVGHTLLRAGAKFVYPLTITRTAHSDDQ